MTKLQEWVFGLTIFAIFYLAVLKDALPFEVSCCTKTFLQFSPIILIGLFGVYSVIVILYRVATFNDCTEAAEELKEPEQQQISACHHVVDFIRYDLVEDCQIKEARKDLISKGFKFE